MTSLGLGDIAAFPFVDAPDSRQIADGVRLRRSSGLDTYAGESRARADAARRGDAAEAGGSRHTAGLWPDSLSTHAWGAC